MAYNYEFTESAIKDLDETLNYIKNNLCNSKAAFDLLVEVQKTIENVCVFPFSYPNCKYYYVKDDTIRHAIVKNYVLFFKIYESKIMFLRFKYSKQNRML